MDYTDALRETHLALSATDWDFRQVAREDEQLLDRSTFKVLDSNHPLLTYRIQSWPTFMGPEKAAEIRGLSTAMFRLVTSIPQRVFGNDPQRLSDFYRLNNPFMAEIIFSEPNGITASVTRGDVIETADGMKCIELNFTPNLGGWETDVIAGLLSDTPAVARFLERLDFEPGFANTQKLFWHHALKETRRFLAEEPDEVNIGIVIGAESRRNDGGVMEAYLNREYAAAREEDGVTGRGKVLVADIEGLLTRPAGVFYAGTRLHTLVELQKEPTPPEVFRAMKARRVCVLNGPTTHILTNKKNLAVLSEHQESDLFTPEERANIAQWIPWTRVVEDRETTHDGKQVHLPEHLLARREDMVLKHGLGYGGKKTSVGRFTPEAEWRAAVSQAVAEHDWVVQEFHDSRPYLYQAGPYGCSPHDVIWGPFVLGGDYAGVILRMQPKADGGPVNLSLTATEGMVFEVPR